jgi:Heterokaryon incompatibility protein (HET)
MWLLDTREKALSWFHVPAQSYAILSHTWGSEEVTHQEIQTLNAHRDGSRSHPITSKAGYRKIEACCDQAVRDGFNWVWIDTCCIDKTSSSELSEAINSMFRWYRESKVCYVYLEDMDATQELQDHLDTHDTESMHRFRSSRWFTRGWTLQELLAPNDLRFFSKSWSLIGDRSSLRYSVSKITGIPPDFLNQRHLSEASIAQRMAWAANRETAREEDVAYCLLGIFDINMPLLYGESGEKAFRRLQEEIIRETNDQSIFAWGFGLPDRDYGTSCLAKSPSDFAGCEDVIPCEAWKPVQLTHFEITKIGVHIELPINIVCRNQKLLPVGVLNCRLTHDYSNLIAIPLESYSSREGANLVLERLPSRAPILCDESSLLHAHIRTVHIKIVKPATTTLTSNSLFCSSALIRTPQDLAFRELYVDASLKSVTRGDHIHVRQLDESETFHGSPTLRKAYFHYWTERSPPTSSHQDDFLVKLEFTPKDAVTRFFLTAISKKFTVWKVRCFIAKARVLPPDYRQTPELLETLEWRQGIIRGCLRITIHVHERTVLGSPMSIVSLKRTPLKQTGLMPILSYDYLLLFQKNLVAVLKLLISRSMDIEVNSQFEYFRILTSWVMTLSTGIIFLVVSTCVPIHLWYLAPLHQAIFIVTVKTYFLAFGIVSLSACFFQSRSSNDGTFYTRRNWFTWSLFFVFAWIILNEIFFSR